MSRYLDFEVLEAFEAERAERRGEEYEPTFWEATLASLTRQRAPDLPKEQQRYEQQR